MPGFALRFIACSRISGADADAGAPMTPAPSAAASLFEVSRSQARTAKTVMQRIVLRIVMFCLKGSTSETYPFGALFMGFQRFNANFILYGICRAGTYFFATKRNCGQERWSDGQNLRTANSLLLLPGAKRGAATPYAASPESVRRSIAPVQ